MWHQTSIYPWWKSPGLWKLCALFSKQTELQVEGDVGCVSQREEAAESAVLSESRFWDRIWERSLLSSSSPSRGTLSIIQHYLGHLDSWALSVILCLNGLFLFFFNHPSRLFESRGLLPIFSSSLHLGHTASISPLKLRKFSFFLYILEYWSFFLYT